MKKVLLALALGTLSATVMAAPAANEKAAETKQEAVPHSSMGLKEGVSSPHGSMSLKDGAEGSTQGMPKNHPAAIPADQNMNNSGKVLEVLNTDMYTYVRIKDDKGELWIAGYHDDKIEKGSTLLFSSGVIMEKFHSSALNRDFDRILFADSMKMEKKK